MTLFSEDETPPKAGAPAGLKFRLLRDARKDPPKKTWLIKGIFALGETSAWIAAPGKLKSALIAEAACAIASGLHDWHGYRVKTPGAVIYFALERATLVERRLLAYQNRENVDDVPIAVVPGILDLTRPAMVDRVVATIQEVEAATNHPVVMIIIDTFAKTIAAGGGDEDKARDQGKVFANLQRIKDALGSSAPHIALIGHTGKDETRGSRGSNSILGDVDLMVTITGDRTRTATSIKANDGEERALFSFKADLVEDGVDDDGEITTISIVSDDHVATRDGKQSAPLSDRNKLALAALDEAVLSHGEPAPAELGLHGIKATSIKHWKAEMMARGIIDKEAKNDRTELSRIKTSLAARSLIGERNGLVWRAKHD
jgi:hypothetical protein